MIIDIMNLVDDYGVTDLKIESESDRKLIRLDVILECNEFNIVNDIRCSWIDRFGNEQFIIPGYPSQMRTDLASVPLILQSFQSPIGKITVPAIFHDGLYQYRPKLANGIRITRAHADYLFYYACYNIGKMVESDCRRNFEIVRIGGSKVWHSHDDEFNDVV
jgi:hypothetical protein